MSPPQDAILILSNAYTPSSLSNDIFGKAQMFGKNKKFFSGSSPWRYEDDSYSPKSLLLLQSTHL